MTRVAYVVSEYPRPSHTFIRREIAALRGRGLDIVPISIRPHAGPGAGKLDAAARAETQSVLGRSPLDHLVAMVAAIARPGRFIATARLALKHRVPGLRALIWSAFHFVEAMTLARLLRRAAVTRVHSHFANSGATVAMLAAHYGDLPWSLTLHGISETDYPAGPLLPGKLARADFVACASWFMRAQAMRVSPPALWPRYAIVRCGVDFERMTPPATSTAGIRTWICVGRLSAEKGHLGLMDAARRLRASGADIALELIGDGPAREALQHHASGLGIADIVAFRGALDEGATLDAIAAADALVLPSFMEGLPLVLMEAMAFAKPVVASGVAGIPELVRDGENGLLVRPSDWNALHDAMARLIADPALARRLGEAGRATVAAEYDIRTAAAPLVDLFARSKVPTC